ncbi:hypothetical protein NEFER03_0040 [Nematocida sp. LUAm3]|nr:hypothetical protein NEFER03_0040 [Nematocida sp. LUAm3]KAI5176256.1 hypothetical protein NEFER02_2053 [Nematocida sp. LUAm2]KAI5176714.1 hypothetical protein NEFER01_0039 [Nematocida sp. LUAm1]
MPRGKVRDLLGNGGDRLLSYAETENLLRECVKQTKDTQIETMRYAVTSVVSNAYSHKEKKQLMDMGLLEFEAIQLLDAPPKKIIDIYVVVEMLEERFSEKQIEELLMFFA